MGAGSGRVTERVNPRNPLPLRREVHYDIASLVRLLHFFYSERGSYFNNAAYVKQRSLYKIVTPQFSLKHEPAYGHLEIKQRS